MHPVPPTNPIHIRDEEVKVKIIHRDNSSDIDHIAEIGIMIDHPTDKMSEDTTSEVATKIIRGKKIQSRSLARKRNFSRRSTRSRLRSPHRDDDRFHKCKQFGHCAKDCPEQEMEVRNVTY